MFRYDLPESTNQADAQLIKDKFNAKPTTEEMTEFLLNKESNNLEASSNCLISS